MWAGDSNAQVNKGLDSLSVVGKNYRDVSKLNFLRPFY